MVILATPVGRVYSGTRVAEIRALRPVTYIVDLPGLDKYYNKSQATKVSQDSSSALRQSEQQTLQRAATHRESGFIAQEVEQAANKIGFTFSGVDKPANPENIYALRYGDFVVPLVKAVQEQQKMIEKLQQIILKQQKDIEALKILSR